MAKIISIGTAVPEHKHSQQAILSFMEGAYGASDKEKRILRYLYSHSGIDARYSTISDFTLPKEQWTFFPKNEALEPFPTMEDRMGWFQQHALPLSLRSAMQCLEGVLPKEEITHLITVSCTGLSAPGLELQLMEALNLAPSTTRTAINFMGCYAAVHGMKMAADIANANPDAKVMVVCTELCSLHFQRTFTEDTITAPLIFGDGSAAILVCGDKDPAEGLLLDSFYAEILKDEKDSMTWNLSSTGFKMTLSSDVPEIFRADIGSLKTNALSKAGYADTDITHWCIHPGGKRILEAIGKGLDLSDQDLAVSYDILRNFGNMSSATILFVLQQVWRTAKAEKGAHIFAAAFGPGLTMESVILTVV